MTQISTYGIFSVKATTITVKQDKDSGWVYDVKWAFASFAREDRKFEVEHMRLLQSAAKAGGIKLECTPMLEGTALDPVMIPTTQRGNITISDDGEVIVSTRTHRYELEDRGIGVEMILSASNCLECTADAQQTLEESIQTELESNREEDAQQLEGQGQLFGDDVPPEVAADRKTRELQAETAELIASAQGQDDVRSENAGDAAAPWDYTLILEVRKQGDRPGTSVTETCEYHNRVDAQAEHPNDPTMHMVRQSPGFGGVLHEKTTTWQPAEFDAETRTAVFRESLKASDRLVDDLSKYGWELKA